jgi:hypothetical protein
MNDTRSAAERLRTLTYHGNGRWTSPEGLTLDEEDVSDLRATLAAAYLAEHDPTPLDDYGEKSVHSNQDVIRKFCELQSKVASGVFEYHHPADCFCGELQKQYVAPVRTYEDGYRNNLAAFRFIEKATLRAMEHLGIEIKEAT